MQIYQIIDHFSSELAENYPPEEISGICELVFEAVLNYSKIDIRIKRNEVPSEVDLQKFENILSRLKENEPIQYILGRADFYGLQLKVAPGVLIPRQETEILVDTIVKDSQGKQALKIIDLCTGSGCIAISLAKFIEGVKVTALDVSGDALKIAKENALNHNVKINFIKADLLKAPPKGSYNIIVSNPPYVRDSERQYMHKNVSEHEPDLALFVSDTDPLLFYRSIAAFAKNTLIKTGYLLVEINEALGDETKQMFIDRGFEECTIIKDLNGKDRFVKAHLK